MSGNNTKSKLRPKLRIVIVGAGPAGSSAAIRLARLGHDVTLVEREKFPRQKLCGEFISPECFRHFRELGVLDVMLASTGDRIAETVFFAPNGRSVTVPSKWFNAGADGALGLSRAEMDFRLLEQARVDGVNVLEEAQATGVSIENKTVTGVQIKKRDLSRIQIEADLTIDATGRARVLGKLVEKESSAIHRTSHREKLVGFKAHLENVDLKKGICEIYFFRGGYGGLNYVEGGAGNHCFLVKADIVKKCGGNVDRVLREVVFENRRAAETLRTAVPIYDWLAVSVDGFGVKNLNPAQNLLAIGDAGAFIDPFTGSGMLMALESAEILAKTLDQNLPPAESAVNFQLVYNQKFGKRLQICNLMRRAAFSPNLAAWIIFLLSIGKKPRELLARATRGSFTD